MSLNENTPTTTITEEYITETIPYISLKTEIKKIPKSIKEAPSISISQSNSVTEHVINVSTDKEVGPYILVFKECSIQFFL